MLDRSRLESLAEPAFRALFSLIFVVAGAKHLLAPDAIVSRLLASKHASLVGFAPPTVLVVLAGVVLLVFGVALLLGLATRVAALALIAVLVPITVTVQVGNPEGLGPLFKNVALVGGLLHFAARGAGRIALDSALRARRGAAIAAMSAIAVATTVAALPALARPEVAPTAATERVLLVVQQPPQLEAALTTGRDALAGRGFPARAVEIVVCGPAVSSLVAGHAFEPRLAEGRAAGMRVVACGLTLEKSGLDPATLSKHVDVVPNGIVEALQRQAEGYRSVEL